MTDETAISLVAALHRHRRFWNEMIEDYVDGCTTCGWGWRCLTRKVLDANMDAKDAVESLRRLHRRTTRPRHWWRRQTDGCTECGWDGWPCDLMAIIGGERAGLGALEA